MTTADWFAWISGGIGVAALIAALVLLGRWLNGVDAFWRAYDD